MAGVHVKTAEKERMRQEQDMFAGKAGQFLRLGASDLGAPKRTRPAIDRNLFVSLSGGGEIDKVRMPDFMREFDLAVANSFASEEVPSGMCYADYGNESNWEFKPLVTMSADHWQSRVAQGVDDALLLYAATRVKGVAGVISHNLDKIEAAGAIAVSLYDSGVIGDIYDNGEALLYLKTEGNGTLGVTGLNASVNTGFYVAADWNDWKFEIAHVIGSAFEAKANIPLPTFGVDVGIELYPTYSSRSAINGRNWSESYTSKAGKIEYSVSSITTNSGNTHGWGMSFETSMRKTFEGPSFQRSLSVSYGEGKSTSEPWFKWER